MPEKILVAVHDPGGASAISPVLVRLLKDPSINLRIYSGSVSEYVMLQKGLSHEKLPTNLQPGEAEQLLKKESPDLLITGTSWNSNAEQTLRNAAYRTKLRSVVILDSWSNYRVRWQGSIYPIRRAADKICIMDEATRLEMVEAGFPVRSLVVTGHPYLDEVFNNPNKNGTSSYHRKEYMSSKQVFLFLSQPLVNLHLMDVQASGSHPIHVLVQALRRLVELNNRDVELVIKLHPKEEICRAFKSVFETSNTRSLKVKLAEKDAKLTKLVDMADVVVGFNSVALFEARARGKRVLSLNYALGCQALNSAMSATGIRLVKPTDSAIVSAILEKHQTHKTSQNSFYGSIENTVQCIHDQLRLFKIEPASYVEKTEKSLARVSA